MILEWIWVGLRTKERGFLYLAIFGEVSHSLGVAKPTILFPRLTTGRGVSLLHGLFGMSSVECLIILVTL